MNTAKELKERLVAHLMEIRLEKLKMPELSIYSDIVRKVDEMEKPGYAETLAAVMSQSVQMGCKHCEEKEEKHG